MWKTIKKHKLLASVVTIISLLALLAGVGYAMQTTEIQANESNENRSVVKQQLGEPLSIGVPTDYDKTNDGYQGVGAWDAPSIGILSAVKFTKAAAGYLGGASLDSAGKVWTWGDNRFGQLGNGKQFAGTGTSTSTRVAYAGGIVRVPYFVDNNINIVEIAAGFYSYYALDDQGNVYAWGDNRSQQLGFVGGNMTTGAAINNSQNIPVKVAGLPKIKSISGTNGYDTYMAAAAIGEDGSLWIWGANNYGIHGQGNTTSTNAYQATPHQVVFSENVDIVKVSIASYAYGPYIHVIDSNGDRWAWGTNNGNVLGISGMGSGAQYTSTPVKIPVSTTAGMSKLVDISSSYRWNIALDENGRVWQWGTIFGVSGGTATTTSYDTPVEVKFSASEIVKVGYTPIPKAVSAGESVSYIIDQYGRSWALGSGRYFGFGREGGYEDANDQMEAEAVQYPKVIGDGDTQIYDTSPKDPEEGRAAGTYGVYSFNQLHPTIYDKKYTDPSEDKWKNLAFSPIPKISAIFSQRSSTMFIDEDGNLFRWGNDGSGSIAWGWDYQSQYDQNGDLVNGLYDRYTYEVMWMRGSPSIDNIGLSIKSNPKKIYKSTGEETPVSVETSFPASFHDANMNFDMQAILKDLKYVYLPYDTTDADFTKSSLTKDEFLELYNRADDANKGDLVDTAISSDDEPKTVAFDVPSAKDNGKLWIMIEDEAYGRTTYTLQAYTFDNFYTELDLDHVGVDHNDLSREVYSSNAENITKITQDGIDQLVGFPLETNGNIIGTTTNPPTFGYDEVKVSKLSDAQLEAIDANLTKYWVWYTPQADSKVYTLNGVDADNSDDITSTAGELAVTDVYTHSFHYDVNPDALVNLHYIGVDASGNRIDEFSMTPNPENQLFKDMEYTRTPPTLSEASGYKIKGYKIVYTTPPLDPVNVTGVVDLNTEGNMVFTIPWDTSVTDATVIVVYEQAPMAYFISADRGVSPYTRVIDFVDENIRTSKDTVFTHEPNDGAIDSEYAIIGYKIFNGKVTDVSTLDLTTAVQSLNSGGEAEYTPPSGQDEYTVVYIYEKAPLVHYVAADKGAASDNLLTDFSMNSERLAKDTTHSKTPVYSNDDYVMVGYKVISGELAAGATDTDISGYTSTESGAASFKPSDYGYELTVIFVYEKKTIVNFVGINGQDADNLVFMDGWDIASRKEVKGSSNTQAPKDYTLPDGYKAIGYYVVNGQVTDPTTVDLDQLGPLNAAGNAAYTVPSNQDEITIIFVYEIPPSVAQLHVRQVIVDSNTKVKVPTAGYMTLTEGKPGTSWTFTDKEMNITTTSRKESQSAKYSDYVLPISKDYMGYGLTWITPQYYEYKGYKISSVNGEYDSTGMNTSKDIQIDFTDDTEYWVTIYLAPVTDNPGNYSWKDALNDFGKILIP
ncbi:hypothetical protein I6N96_16780 [Enterococcus sp. BWM-S5]|uniref:Uncharacterized protein n=1 Tax=Enterococcus larvae TaxID=2794352 RepID=A0ABS4CPK9_9ENTE|nr:hypothetical protein [Enterococcus larvae]MBP1047947.1 hypothetical protein [Enterococcus larvae]